MLQKRQRNAAASRTEVKECSPRPVPQYFLDQTLGVLARNQYPLIHIEGQAAEILFPCQVLERHAACPARKQFLVARGVARRKQVFPREHIVRKVKVQHMAEKKPRGLRGFFSARRRKVCCPAALRLSKGLGAHALASSSGNTVPKFFRR